MDHWNLAAPNEILHDHNLGKKLLIKPVSLWQIFVQIKGVDPVAQSILLMEREELSGPDYAPIIDPALQKWASQGGSAFLRDQKTKLQVPRLRHKELERWYPGICCTRVKPLSMAWKRQSISFNTTCWGAFSKLFQALLLIWMDWSISIIIITPNKGKYKIILLLGLIFPEYLDRLLNNSFSTLINT